MIRLGIFRRFWKYNGNFESITEIVKKTENVTDCMLDVTNDHLYTRWRVLWERMMYEVWSSFADGHGFEPDGFDAWNVNIYINSKNVTIYMNNYVKGI